MQFDAIRQARGQFAPNVVRHSGPLDSLSTRRAHPNGMESPSRIPVSSYFDLVSCEMRKDPYTANADSTVLLDKRPYFLLKVSGKLNSILPEMHSVQPDQNNCTSGQVFKLKKNSMFFDIVVLLPSSPQEQGRWVSGRHDQILDVKMAFQKSQSNFKLKSRSRSSSANQDNFRTLMFYLNAAVRMQFLTILQYALGWLLAALLTA